MKQRYLAGNSRWLWIVGCVVLLALCTGVLIIGSLFLLLPTAEPSVSIDPSRGQDESGDPNIGTIPLPEDDRFENIRLEIEEEVAEIRGLEPLRPVTPTFFTKSDLRNRLEADLVNDYSPQEARDDAIVLSAFDFVDADFDLRTFVLDLLVEQIVGFYDTETDEFVLVVESEFGLSEQLTHAHEFVHALQDQHYGLDRSDEETLSDDASLAFSAFVEGEAGLVQTQYMLSGAIDFQELVELLSESLAIDTTVLDSAPPVLASELNFPYTSGLEFAQALFEQGGNATLELAWGNPPQSTEQIIHPERYLSGDQPQIVSLAPLTSTLGAGWRMVDDDVLGEFYLRQYLIQQLPQESVEIAAAGWGGDRYAVYWRDSDQGIVMVLRLSWDSVADGQEFIKAYAGYPAGLLGVEGRELSNDATCWSGRWAICLANLGEEVLVVRAPGLELAADIIQIQQR